MRASLRAVAVAAIVAVAVAVGAQEPCPPPADPVLQWVGQTSGCTPANGLPCQFGEVIIFSVSPFTGGSYPPCVTYFWDFGDGESSELASPAHVYGVTGTFFVLVRVRGGDVDVFDGKPMVIIPATVVPVIERFGASATAVLRGRTVVLSWSTRNATSLRIDPLGVTLGPTVTSYSFVPTATRTYTLTAFGSAAFRISGPVTVVVSTRRRAARH